MKKDQSNQDEAKTDLTARFEVDGVEFEGSVLSIADCTIKVAYSSSQPRSLALPAEVNVGVSGGILTEEVLALGRVNQWTHEDGHDCLRLDIKDEQFAIIESAIYPQRAERTAVRGSKAIRVVLRPLEGITEVAAALVDLSDSGVALILSSDADRQLAHCEAVGSEPSPWRLQLCFTLPGNETELECVGQLCYRMFTRKCVKYGIKFDWDASVEASSSAEEDIRAHMDRFRDEGAKAA